MASNRSNTSRQRRNSKNSKSTSKKTSESCTNVSIASALHTLSSSGGNSFESLLAELLRSLTGYLFRVCQSGSQAGRDGEAVVESSSIMFECKRYLPSTPINIRELTAEVTQVMNSGRPTDVWILASTRSVPAQFISELFVTVKGQIDIVSLECNAEGTGELDHLCAEFPSITLEALSKSGFTSLKELSQCLSATQQKDVHAATLKTLKQNILQPKLGWPAWRESENRVWQELLANKADCKAKLGQVLYSEANSDFSVTRVKPLQELENWWLDWPAHKKRIAVLGDEGNGKSWTVAEWLSTSIKKDFNFPPVIFLTSKLIGRHSSIEHILTDHVSNSFPTLGLSRDQWRLRINRWQSNPECRANAPLALLILDGLNERQPPSFWHDFLYSINNSEWKNNLAVICTSRQSFWSTHFGSLVDFDFQESIVSEFSETELRQALKQRGKLPSEFTEGMRKLLKKPRYFDLAFRHSERLAELGDFTIQRLVYEDWKDRYLSKNLPLSDQEFNDLLKDLAERQRNGLTKFDNNVLQNSLTRPQDFDRTLEELSSSGVLEKIAGGWKVEAKNLGLGLGLLLCEGIANTQNTDEALESISAWLEVNSNLDIYGEILENATIHALIRGLPNFQCSALLLTWLNSQNYDSSEGSYKERSLTAYLPQKPEAYLELCELIWSYRYDNPWAQEHLLEGLICWSRKSELVLAKVVEACDRWSSYILKDGPRQFRTSANEETREEFSFKKMCERIGYIPVSSNFKLGDNQFELIEDDGLSRLTYVSLIIISHLSEIRCFIPAIVRSIIAESVAGYLEKASMFTWILRKQDCDVTGLISAHLHPLVNSSSKCLQQAAARTYFYIGSPEAIEEWNKLDTDELFPTPLWLTAWQKNSERQISTRKQFEDRAREHNLNPFEFAGTEINRLASVRDMSLPAAISSVFKALLSEVADKKNWLHIGRTENQTVIDTKELFARYCPNALCDSIRSGIVANEFQDLTLVRRLAFEAYKFDLIFTDKERIELLKIAQNFCEELLAGNFSAEESYLFSYLLPLWNGDEQLVELLKRKEFANDLLFFADAFRPVTSSIEIKSLSEIARARYLWILTTTKQNLVEDGDLQTLLNSTTNTTKGLAYQYLYVNGTKKQIDNWLQTDWHWHMDNESSEDEIASQLIIEKSTAWTSEQLIERVHPRKRGQVIAAKNPLERDIDDYRLWLQQKIELMISYKPIQKLPRIAIEFSEDVILPPYSWSLENDNFSHFHKASTLWGGRTKELDENFFRFNPVKENSERKKAYDIASDESKRASSEGNFWLISQFERHGIAKLIQTRPEVLLDWLELVSSENESVLENISNAVLFYLALCEELFMILSRHLEASDLFKKLKAYKGPIKLLARDLNIERINCVLFNSSLSFHTQTLWEEQLENCTTDLQLLELALAVRSSNHVDIDSWMKTKLRHDLLGEIPVKQARAIVLGGFLNYSDTDLVFDAADLDSEVWMEQAKLFANFTRESEKDSKAWFTEFCTEESVDKSWCAFELFLQKCDRRCWLWVEELVCLHNLPDKKRFFYKINKQDIRARCESNEKNFATRFLCCDVQEDLSPWFKLGMTKN